MPQSAACPPRQAEDRMALVVCCAAPDVLRAYHPRGADGATTGGATSMPRHHAALRLGVPRATLLQPLVWWVLLRGALFADAGNRGSLYGEQSLLLTARAQY